MNIENVKYTSFDGENNTGIKATIDGTEIHIPLNTPDNRHYQAIQEWVAEGNTIQEAD